MKVSELNGSELDYWVARAEGMGKRGSNWVGYSTHWAAGGPIIEREEITVERDGYRWIAKKYNPGHKFVINHSSGKTYLVAAMRCFVACKFGDEVNDE